MPLVIDGLEQSDVATQISFIEHSHIILLIQFSSITGDSHKASQKIPLEYLLFQYALKCFIHCFLSLHPLINNEIVEAFSMVVYEPKWFEIGIDICERLKELIPKHLFSIPIQAAFGSKIIARETISAIKKDVLAKCYGWDISRKRKLLEKQKEWKKKMKEIGKVSIPNDIFIRMMKR